MKINKLFVSFIIALAFCLFNFDDGMAATKCKATKTTKTCYVTKKGYEKYYSKTVVKYQKYNGKKVIKTKEVTYYHKSAKYRLTYTKYFYNKQGKLKSNKYGKAYAKKYYFFKNNKISKRIDYSYNEKGKLKKVRTVVTAYRKNAPDTVKPKISLSGIPSQFKVGSSYVLPTSYTKETPKGLTSKKCLVGSKVVTNTNQLAVGKYTINCSVTTLANYKASVSKTIEVTKNVVDTVVPKITLTGVPSKVLYAQSYILPTSYTTSTPLGSTTKSCKAGSKVVTNTNQLAVGKYTITCTVITKANKQASVSKAIEVYKAGQSCSLNAVPSKYQELYVINELGTHNASYFNNCDASAPLLTYNAKKADKSIQTITLKPTDFKHNVYVIKFTPNSKTVAIAKDIFEKVNAKRSSLGLNKLVWNDEISYGASIRSREIAVNFNHSRLDGSDLWSVVDETKFPYSLNGENIVMAGGYPENQIADLFYQMWYDSAGHRENMLRSTFKSIGIGVFYNEADGCYYATQLFSNK